MRYRRRSASERRRRSAIPEGPRHCTASAPRRPCPTRPPPPARCACAWATRCRCWRPMAPPCCPAGRGRARPVLAGKPPPFGKRIAAIDAHAPLALREGEKREIAFRADCLTARVPAFSTLDEQPAEHVVRLVLVELYAAGGAHGGRASVCSNDEPCARQMHRAVTHIFNAGSRPRFNFRHIDAAQRQYPRLFRLVEQRLAVMRMADA